MGNLIVELGPERADKSLMLMAYAMTHPASRMKEPYAGELIDGAGRRLRARPRRLRAEGLARLRARRRQGRAEPAAQGPAGVHGLDRRRDRPPRRRDQHRATRIGYSPKLAVIVIGTTSRIALANKGRVDVIVTVRGKAAHSSTPWAGVNAIEGARRVLERVMAVDLGTGRHNGLGQATLTPTAMRSWPEATHTVQDEVRLVFDRRLLPGDDPQAAFAAVAKAADIGEPWTVKTEFGPFMYPAEIAADGVLVRAATARLPAHGLAAPQPFHSHGALDAGYFCHKGGEATMWGPGAMDQWHSDDERIAVTDLMDGAAAYLGLIEDYLCQ